MEVGEQVHHLAAVRGVEVTRRLVGKDELGVGDDGTGDGHTLLLTTAQLLREVVLAVLDGHARHDVFHALAALGGGDVHVAQRQLDVFKHVQLVDEVEALEHEADVALAELGAVLFLEAAHLLAEQFILAVGGVVQEAEDVEQGRLAAARGAHDGDELAVVDFERNAVEGDGLNLDVLATEDFFQVFYFDHFFKILIVIRFICWFYCCRLNAGTYVACLLAVGRG